MTKNNQTDHNIMLIITALLAWFVPGAGHFFIKERKRGVIIFLTITAIFVTGLYIGSIAVVDKADGFAWYIAQMMVSPAVHILSMITSTGDYISYGRPAEIGQIYTTLAGLLNLLCIISAVYMAHSGRTEIIGQQEQNSTQTQQIKEQV